MPYAVSFIASPVPLASTAPLLPPSLTPHLSPSRLFPHHLLTPTLPPSLPRQFHRQYIFHYRGRHRLVLNKIQNKAQAQQEGELNFTNEHLEKDRRNLTLDRCWPLAAVASAAGSVVINAELF